LKGSKLPCGAKGKERTRTLFGELADEWPPECVDDPDGLREVSPVLCVDIQNGIQVFAWWVDELRGRRTERMKDPLKNGENYNGVSR